MSKKIPERKMEGSRKGNSRIRKLKRESKKRAIKRGKTRRVQVEEGTKRRGGNQKREGNEERKIYQQRKTTKRT